MASITKICSIEGCDKSVKARGWCDTHYQRWQHHGDPTFTLREMHGMNHLPEYKLWIKMRLRCNNPNDKHHYPDYGGRGIKVCERWNSFTNFYKDVGSRPSLKHSLSRIDNDGDYEPSNVEWATVQEQNKNRRPVISNRKYNEALARIKFLEEQLYGTEFGGGTDQRLRAL